MRVWGFLLGDFYDQDRLLRLRQFFWSQQNFQNDGVRVYFQKIEVLFFLAKVPTFQDTGGIFYYTNCIFIGHNFSITHTFLCLRWFFKIMITTFYFRGGAFFFRRPLFLRSRSNFSFSPALFIFTGTFHFHRHFSFSLELFFKDLTYPTKRSKSIPNSR